MLIDEVEITLRAGHGGPGRVSFNPGKRSGPNGGNGGKGGDIYISVTTDLRGLNQFSNTKIREAENGVMGGKFQQTGKDGKDLEIIMPLGTEITDQNTGEVFELNDLSKRILICKGGLGGRGNFEFKSASNTTPMYAQKGLPGQERLLKLELKFIADFGLIGLPNAGKSSLLNELTAASARVASYPFTTLEPNLGAWNKKIIADIPGLIEGAAEGKGLGIKFLKHIEKVKLLLHCISLQSEDALKNYQVVSEELKKCNPKLLEKEEIIILTKTDLVDSEEIKNKTKQLKKLKKQIIPVSIHDWDSLQNLQELLKQALMRLDMLTKSI
ncbi:GTPase ObgE [Candidatus Daviesbacteria bacterium]|nr:GTPase ObgE [Candidatus Daviesbacteria bacterium]